jgi:hypothetical protein
MIGPLITPCDRRFIPPQMKIRHVLSPDLYWPAGTRAVVRCSSLLGGYDGVVYGLDHNKQSRRDGHSAALSHQHQPATPRAQNRIAHWASALTGFDPPVLIFGDPQSAHLRADSELRLASRI